MVALTQCNIKAPHEAHDWYGVVSSTGITRGLATYHRCRGIEGPIPELIQHLWKPGKLNLESFCENPEAKPLRIFTEDSTNDDYNAIPVCTLCHKKAMKYARQEAMLKVTNKVMTSSPPSLDQQILDELRGIRGLLQNSLDRGR